MKVKKSNAIISEHLPAHTKKVGKTVLCYCCKRNPISPFEVELCDFCADELRYIA